MCVHAHVVVERDGDLLKSHGPTTSPNFLVVDRLQPKKVEKTDNFSLEREIGVAGLWLCWTTKTRSTATEVKTTRKLSLVRNRHLRWGDGWVTLGTWQLRSSTFLRLSHRFRCLFCLMFRVPPNRVSKRHRRFVYRGFFFSKQQTR